MNIKDIIRENDKSDSDLFGSASVRDKLHKQINSLYDKIVQEYDDLGFEALMHTKVYSKLFDKWDEGEHDPNEVMAYKEPVNLLVQAVAEMEDVSQNAYDYLELEENKESDSDLFGDPGAVSIRAVRALRDQNQTNKDPFNNTRQYGDHRIKSNGKIYRQDQEARRHRVGARLGRHANPVLPEGESDDDLFSTARRAPPKDLNLLLGWAGNDPEKEDFAYVAKFGIKHNMNLKQTLEVLQYFDDVPGNSRLEKKWGVSEALAMRLFIAYEDTYDAWEPSSNNGDQAAQDFWEAADAELAEPPESPRRTAAPTKDKPKLDPNMFAPQLDQPLAKTDPLDDLKKNAGIGGDQPTVDLRKSSQANTLNKTAGLGSDDMSNMLGRMRDIDIDKDLDAYPDQDSETVPSVEVNTANLPAVAGQALQAAGVENPEFHQVANLPGNMADQIRQLGKSLFGSMTMTPTKRIHVIANLGGKGPNSTQEVNAVAGFLKQHGSDRGPGDVDFDAVMPGYKAQTHMYTAAGIRWMLVKDFAGQYIYCWPEEDSHDAAPALGNDSPEAPRLR
jgi:hypothetical protein